MSTIATMGMRSILFFGLILGSVGAFGATADRTAITNAASASGASLENARSLLADAVRNLTNNAAKATVETPAKVDKTAKVAAAPASKVETAITTNGVAVIPAAPVTLDALDDKIRLHPGDIVRFRVQEDKEDDKRLNITDGGEVGIPYIGYVKADGKTCKELALDVKRVLEEKYYYQATVNIAVESVLKKSLGRIYVYGRGVSGAGPQDIPADEPWTVGKAVLRAGPTEFADLKTVKLFKKGADISAMDATTIANKEKNAIVVDVRDIRNKGRVEKDQPVEPGDVIVVDVVLVHLGN